MKTGEWIIYYSPKVWFKESAPYQKFTALGRVVDDHIFQFDMGDDFKVIKNEMIELKGN